MRIKVALGGTMKIKAKKMVKYLLITSIVMFAIGAYFYHGNHTIKTTHIRFEHTAIPEPFSGFVIAHVSDLHNYEWGDNQHRLLDKISSENPDIIVITGDLIDSNHQDNTIAMDFIEGAVLIAPVYFVTGNHEAWIDDYARLETLLLEAGVTVLKETSQYITIEGRHIGIFGVDDPEMSKAIHINEDNASRIDTAIKNTDYDDTLFTILLSHRPELFDVYVDNNIDLVLSGHAHGGQFRMPFIGGLIDRKSVV